MQEFYNSIKAIVGFLVIVLIFNLATNESATQKMVLLVLMSILLLNSQNFINFLSNQNK